MTLKILVTSLKEQNSYWQIVTHIRLTSNDLIGPVLFVNVTFNPIIIRILKFTSHFCVSTNFYCCHLQPLHSRELAEERIWTSSPPLQSCCSEQNDNTWSQLITCNYGNQIEHDIAGFHALQAIYLTSHASLWALWMTITSLNFCSS